MSEPVVAVVAAAAVVEVVAEDAMPASTPALATAPSSYIELDTSSAQHRPHVEPHEEAKEEQPTAVADAAAAPSSVDEDEEEETEDSEPMSEVDDAEEDPAENRARMEAFLQALEYSEGAAAAAAAASSSSSADDTEAFSEAENGFAHAHVTNAAHDPTLAAINEVQEYVNRQAALAAAKANEPRSPSTAAAARQARKVEFAAQVEARRRAMKGERDEDEEEEEEEEVEVNTPLANAGVPHGEAEEEEDEEEEEEAGEGTFYDWLKGHAHDTLNGKVAHQIRARSKWLTWTALEWGGRFLYVASTLALIAVPLAVAELNEQNSLARQQRLARAPIPDELKQEIWTGITASTSTENMNMTLV
jgi:hypothetical protein